MWLASGGAKGDCAGCAELTSASVIATRNMSRAAGFTRVLQGKVSLVGKVARNMVSQQREDAPGSACRAQRPVCGHELEDKFSAKFQQARPVIAGNGAEVAVVGVVIQVLEFSVVERVERLKAQFELR